MRVYCDAATYGHQGIAGAGVLVVDDDLHEQLTFSLNGRWTIHEAEWQAIFKAMDWLVDNHHTEPLILLHTDSQIITDTINKNYAKATIHQENLKKFKGKQKQFHYLEVKWIARSQNKGADQLAKQALQQAIKHKKASTSR